MGVKCNGQIWGHPIYSTYLILLSVTYNVKFHTTLPTGHRLLHTSICTSKYWIIKNMVSYNYRNLVVHIHVRIWLREILFVSLRISDSKWHLNYFYACSGDFFQHFLLLVIFITKLVFCSIDCVEICIFHKKFNVFHEFDE